MKDRTASIPGYYVEFLANVIRQLPRPEQIDQTTVEGWSNNQKALKETLAKALLPVKPTVNGPRFELLRSFELMIPTDYIHATQLDSFVKNNYGRCDHDITDEHFSGVSYELVPGKTYECRIYKIAKHVSVSPQDCLAFMKKIGAFFVGAQGLSLAFQCKQRELPSLYFVTSFDEEVRLWKGPDHYFRAPHTHGNRDDIGWEFGLSYFYCGLRSTDCLLCFCDKPSD